MFTSLIAFNVRSFKKFFETKTLAKVITTLLFCLVFWFVATGIYFFLLTGLRFALFQMSDETQNALIYFLYESFYLTLFFLILLSSTISLLFSFFQTKKDTWIIATPGYSIYTHTILTKVFFGIFFPTLILFTPLSIALAHVVRLPLLTTASLYLSFTLLLVITVLLTASFILFFAWSLTRLQRLRKTTALNFRQLLFSFIFVFIFFCSYGVSSLKNIDLPSLFRVTTASVALETKDIASHFLWSPSHLAATHALCITIKNNDTSCKNSPLIPLSFLTIISFFVFSFLSKTHFSLWKQFQDNPRSVPAKLLSSRNHFFEGSSWRAIFEREYLGMIRDLKGVFWLLFLVALWIIEILVYTITKHTYIKHGISFDEYLPRIVATQAMITLYFISAFTLRFVYPSFSVEKKMKWILWTSPLSFLKRYISKLVFFSLLFTSLGVLMIMITASALSLPLLTVTYSLTLLVPSFLLIISTGLALGTFFGDDDSNDAESATTSISGLFFTGISLLYGAIGSYTLFLGETHNNHSTLLIYSVFSIIIFFVLTKSSVLYIGKNKL